MVENDLLKIDVGKSENSYSLKNQLKEIGRGLYPTFILILLFFLLFLILFFCFYNIFFPLKYVDEIKEFSNKYDVSPSLVASVINVESGFDCDSISNKGAVGLMQIMPTTANFISYKINFSTDEGIVLTDVKTNLELGIAYLSYLSQKYDDTFTLLCAYNAGEGNVSNWLKDSRYSLDGKKLKITPYKETNFYAQKVLRGINFYQNRISKS